MILGEKTDANKRVNPLHFCSNLVDIQIWINVETRIRIEDHFCLRFWPWRRFALFEHSLVWFVVSLASAVPGLW